MTTAIDPRGEPSVLALPFAARSASVARQRLAEFLEAMSLSGDLVDDSRLVISELVGNAVRHARPLVDGTMLVGWTFRAETTGGVCVDIFVTDGGSSSVPAPGELQDEHSHGRGLILVEALASRWWYETVETPEPRGTVHAVVGPEMARPTA